MKKILSITTILFLLSNVGYSQEDCPPIATFPYREGFENNEVEFPPCWELTTITLHWSWEVVPASAGAPAHNGNYKIRAFGDCSSDITHNSTLVTPVFDLSNLNNPVLNFWFTKTGSGHLGVCYKDFSSETWTTLTFLSEDVPNWQYETILLPNRSNQYQIQFWGIFSGGEFCEIQLDDISVSDGGLSVLPYHTDNYVVGPNPVQDYVAISGIYPQKITLYDTQGRILLTKTDSFNKIDMSHLSKGLYFLHIISDKGTVYVEKLIKQ